MVVVVVVVVVVGGGRGERGGGEIRLRENKLHHPHLPATPTTTTTPPLTHRWSPLLVLILTEDCGAKGCTTSTSRAWWSSSSSSRGSITPGPCHDGGEEDQGFPLTQVTIG